MIQKYMFDYIRESLGDEYAMEVLYYTLKKTVVDNDYNIKDLSFFDIDGRFHGEMIRVGTRMRYRSEIHAISLLLSVRALMLNERYFSRCENDHLMFTSIPKEKFQWIENATIILDSMRDDEFAMLYDLLEDVYFDDELSDNHKEHFEQSVIKPEFRNTLLYYRNIASSLQGVVDNVICDNAFVCEDYSTYEVGEVIAYIGNTAFAYCENLETIRFKGQVTFGNFPIVECEKLRQIIVPTHLLNYYREELQFYKDIISDEEKKVSVKTNLNTNVSNVLGNRMIDASEIEIVYVDIPSADSYTEVEMDDDEIILADEHNDTIDPIDIKKFETVFDKKATSYKYFWLTAIVTLAKEKGTLVIPYKDITIRMAALAWPIAFNDGINLGTMDQLTKYLTLIKTYSSLTKLASVDVVEDYIVKHFESRDLGKTLEPLLKNVPYRFLSPWIVFTTTNEVVDKSRAKGFSGPYSLYDDHIVLNKYWREYFVLHYDDVRKFTLQSFMDYAKKYNSDIKFSRLKRKGWGF